MGLFFNHQNEILGKEAQKESVTIVGILPMFKAAEWKILQIRPRSDSKKEFKL